MSQTSDITLPQVADLLSQISHRFAPAFDLLSQDLLREMRKKDGHRLFNIWLSRVLRVRMGMGPLKVYWQSETGDAALERLIPRIGSHGIPISECDQAYEADVAIVSPYKRDRHDFEDSESAFCIFPAPLGNARVFSVSPQKPCIFWVNSTQPSAHATVGSILRTLFALKQ